MELQEDLEERAEEIFEGLLGPNKDEKENEKSHLPPLNSENVDSQNIERNNEDDNKKEDEKSEENDEESKGSDKGEKSEHDEYKESEKSDEENEGTNKSEKHADAENQETEQSDKAYDEDENKENKTSDESVKNEDDERKDSGSSDKNDEENENNKSEKHKEDENKESERSDKNEENEYNESEKHEEESKETERSDKSNKEKEDSESELHEEESKETERSDKSCEENENTDNVESIKNSNKEESNDAESSEKNNEETKENENYEIKEGESTDVSEKISGIHQVIENQGKEDPGEEGKLIERGINNEDDKEKGKLSNDVENKVNDILSAIADKATENTKEEEHIDNNKEQKNYDERGTQGLLKNQTDDNKLSTAFIDNLTQNFDSDDSTPQLVEVSTEADLPIKRRARSRPVEKAIDESEDKTFETTVRNHNDGETSNDIEETDKPRRRKSNQKQRKSGKSKKNNDIKNFEDGNYTDEDLKEALDLMRKKKILPHINIRQPVIEYARDLVVEKMIKEEYDEANEIDCCIDIMFTSLANENKIDTSEREMIQERLDQNKEKKKEIINRWNQRIHETKEQNIHKKEELYILHDQEKEAFAREWNKPRTISMFNKPSPGLSQLRKQQKALALVHDFQSAKTVKAEADEREKAETYEGLRRAELAMKTQYTVLLERQQRESDVLDDSTNASVEKLEQLRDRELKSILNAEKQLTAKLTNLNSKKPQIIVPVVNGTKSRGTSATYGRLSSRARSQVSTYRNTSESANLNVKLNVNQMLNDVEGTLLRRRQISSMGK